VDTTVSHVRASATAGNGHLEGVDGELGGHAPVDRVADDPVGEHVLHCAQVELGVPGPVFRNVREPQVVGPVSSEFTAHEIVMNRGPGTLARPSPDRVAAADMDQPAGLQHLVVRHVQATVPEFVGQEPVAELRIITMRVKDGVRGLRVGPFPLADRVGEPLVVGLSGEPQDPTRELHRNPVAGQVRDDGEGL